jgi:hypothetical protein
MKRFTVKIPCRSASEAARVYLLAQRLKPKEERMTQMAISKVLGVTVQNVNEQKPRIKALLRASARA